MKLKTFMVIVGLSAALPASAAFAPPATAFIDWSTFNVQLIDVNSSGSAIAWTSKSSYVDTNSTSDSAGDWTSSINALDGVASATADASVLRAEFSAVPTGLNSSAWLYRDGTFTLTANTIAVFTVDASTSIDMSVPINGSAYAWTYFNVDGNGVLDTVNPVQHSGTESISWASGLGNPVSDARTLQATFLNLTDHEMTGTLSAFATVNKYGFIPVVPEPETYAMMLAGIGVIATIARRRKKPGA